MYLGILKEISNEVITIKQRKLLRADEKGKKREKLLKSESEERKERKNENQKNIPVEKK